MDVDTPSLSWRFEHSLWVIWAIVPTLAWVAFLWIGYKGRERAWLIWGAVYFVVLFLGVWVPIAIYGSSNEGVSTVVGLLLIFGTLAAIGHALLVRKHYLLRLNALQPINQAEQRAEAATLREDYGDPQAETRARALFEQCNTLVMEIEGDLSVEVRSRPGDIRTLYADALGHRAEGERLLDSAKRPHEFHAAESPLKQAMSSLEQVRNKLSAAPKQ